MNQKLEDFFHSLDRSYFIDHPAKSMAAMDVALPIGFDQTISQPSLVRYMTEALSLEADARVLEIGTGSGYQTAFLAEFSLHVYTIERIEHLSITARERLDALGYRNISYCIGDGSSGWKDQAPYDRIIVTAAPVRMPKDIVKQLAPQGTMILPLGQPGRQQLYKIQKDQQGVVHTETLLNVAFVQLQGKYL